MGTTKAMEGWHRVKKDLAHAHRWRSYKSEQGRELVESICAIGISVDVWNIEKAGPGHAICKVCREITLEAMEPAMLEIVRGVGDSAYSGEFGLVPRKFLHMAEQVIKELPPQGRDDGQTG